MNDNTNRFNIEVVDDSRPSAFDRMWDEYERVVLQSILTSFGLDFLVHDQRGGDVDTIHVVLESGNFKNELYKDRYDTRGKYDVTEYHNKSQAYRDTKKQFNEAGNTVKDAYDPERTLFFNKGAGPWNRAALDHVLAAKRIHDDPLRIMANLDGVTLANDPSNLRYTNMSLNSKMRDMSMPEFFQWCDEHPDKVKWNGELGAPIPEEVKAKMIEEEARAKEHYVSVVSHAYYSNPQFYLDTFKAAGKRGIEMGARQALGFAFLEIWFACKDELNAVPVGSAYGEFLKAIIKGVPKGIDNARKKYTFLISQFEQGFNAGMLASLTTTLCNIFITTDVNTIKYIRFAYTAVVQAGTVILVNPDDYAVGDQIKIATAMLANGASTIAGSVVGDAIAKTPIGQEPHVGKTVQTFVSVLVSGLLSCSLLMLMDSSKFINDLIDRMNKYASESRSISELARALEEEAAELGKYDIEAFKEDANKYTLIATRVAEATDETELNEVLLASFSLLDIKTPWGEDFDAFMGKNSYPPVFD